MITEHILSNKSVSDLRAYACYEAMMAVNQWTDTNVDEELVLRGSGLQYKWGNRKGAPSFMSIEEFVKKSPVIQEIYELPLWELLTTSSLSKKRVAELVKPFRGDTLLVPYEFPSNQLLIRPDREPLPTTLIEDSNRLFARGDVNGLMALAGLVREAEAAKDFDVHVWCLGDLFRILPAAGKSSLFKGSFNLLCEVAKQLQQRVPMAMARMSIDWKIIHGQYMDPDFEPCREFRVIDNSTRRFQEIADPIRFHSGFDIGRPTKVGSSTTSSSDSESLATDFEAMGRAMKLIEHFMLLVRIWRIDRHSWEPLLASNTSRLDEARFAHVSSLGATVDERIEAMIEIRETMNRSGMSDQDQKQFLRAPQLRLFDRTILQAISEGDYVGALATTKATCSTQTSQSSTD